MSEESKQDRVARWQKRVEEAPDSAAAHYNLGLAHTERGRMMPAETAYRRAVELDPDLVQAWVNLGGALLMKWDFQGSLEANREAVRRQDDLLQAHYNMGQAYLYLNDAEQLVRCNRRVLELQEDHPAAHYFLAVGLLATDQVDEARAECSRATSLGYQPRPEFLKSLDRAEKALVQKDTTSASPEAEAPGDAKEE
jgi:tetratricopeptide (TPR) repeat protein